MKGWDNLSFWSLKGPKGPTDEFYGCERIRKTFWFCDLFISKRQRIYSSYKRDAKGVFERGVLWVEGIRNGYLFLSKIFYKKGEGLDLGDEPLATKSSFHWGENESLRIWGITEFSLVTDGLGSAVFTLCLTTLRKSSLNFASERST